jgi:ubiquitin C-terminal hydrolase
MEEPEDAPPPVVDGDVAAQHHSFSTGLHNVSNTCYLNATVQVKTFSKSFRMMFEQPVFVFVLFLRRNAF